MRKEPGPSILLVIVLVLTIAVVAVFWSLSQRPAWAMEYFYDYVLPDGYFTTTVVISGILQLAPSITPTGYTPWGIYTTSYFDIRPVPWPDYHAALTSLCWTTTITDPQVMTVTLAYRYYDPEAGQWTAWSPWIPSRPGIGVTTTVEFPANPRADFFQSRIFLSTTVPTQTPLLYSPIRIGELAPPDLVATDLTVAGGPTASAAVEPGQSVLITFTVQNRSSSVPTDSLFLAMLFVTTTPNYLPTPPACPNGCDCSQPETCPLIWSLQPRDFEEADPPLALTTTWTFTRTGSYYLVACVDYSPAPAQPPPYYDVVELLETNNCASLAVTVEYKRIFVPLLIK